MNAIPAIVRANLTRLRAERSNWFFIVALPLLIVAALGLAFGGNANEPRVGVVDPSPNAASTAVRERLTAADHVHVVSYSSASEMRDAVARGDLDAGYAVRVDEGITTVQWYASPTSDTTSLRLTADAAVSEAALADAAKAVVGSDTGASGAQLDAVIDRAGSVVPAVAVKVSSVDTAADDPNAVRAVLAGGELTLFVFLTSLTGAAYLLTTRQLGVTRRMRAAPVTVTEMIAGESISRFLVALLQGAIVFFGSALLFGVDWKSPAAVVVLVIAMAAVGSGAAMLLGSLGRSEQQVGALALFVSLLLAALGGSMQPLHFFPDGLRQVAFVVTPHAWMNDALWGVLVDGKGVGSVWASVAALAVRALVLLGAAVAVMRRQLR